jgi:hypothetical protein
MDSSEQPPSISRVLIGVVLSPAPRRGGLPGWPFFLMDGTVHPVTDWVIVIALWWLVIIGTDKMETEIYTVLLQKIYSWNDLQQCHNYFQLVLITQAYKDRSHESTGILLNSLNTHYRILAVWYSPISADFRKWILACDSMPWVISFFVEALLIDHGNVDGFGSCTQYIHASLS